MTAPAGEAESQDPTALVQAIKKRAVELGIAWELLTATMATTTTAVVDGDTVAVPVISLSGAHPEGTKVGLMRVPPSGLYVIGVVSSTEPSQVVARGEARVTALLVLSTTPTALTGGSVTMTAPSDVYWEATAFYDMEATVAGAAVGVGSLYVDGVAQTGQALLSFNVTTLNRGTPGQQWRGTLSAGDHTFELYGSKSAAGSTSRINNLHTYLMVTFYA